MYLWLVLQKFGIRFIILCCNPIFHVDESGRPFDIKVKAGLCPSADKEAVRLVEEGPDWTIGGKEVTLSVKF